MTRRWETLEGAIDGVVVLPDAPDYDAVRRPAMARFDSVRPAAVVRCTSAGDVAETIAFARSAALDTAVRCGGHSVAGRSSTKGILIDVTPMSSVSVEAGVATVGAGTRLGTVYDALDEHGLTIPAGCAPSVGIAGLTLGGGIGILGRSHGLTSDHLLRADVVLGDGRVVECDEHHHPDLFWALRGAGGGHFGVVTSLVFRTVPAPDATVFRLTWPAAGAEGLVDAWLGWAPTAPDGLDATLRLAPGNGVELFGAWLGAEAEAATLLDAVIAAAGAEPATAERRHLSYRDAKRYLEQGGPEARHLFTKSEFFRRVLPRDAIAALVDNLAGTPGREVAFLPWGGAYNRVRADATSFAHRDERYLLQHLALIDPHAPTDERDWLTRSWSIVHAWGSGGVYPNFPDPDLRDWARAYHGSNFERLLSVKASYDPTGFFRFAQSLPSGHP
jgi:FAD/FMN-containing dehydrogenase